MLKLSLKDKNFIVFLKDKKAFSSLVEMALVVLIIAILITAVFLAKDIIKKSRISAAQSLTKSSIVNSMESLSLWMESSLDNSFLSEKNYNGSSLSIWKDLKPYGVKVNLVQSDDLSQPIYSNTIHNIPAVQFDGVNSYFEFDGSFLNNSGYTIVILEKRQSNKSDNYFFGDSSITMENQNIILGYQNDREIIHSQGGTNSYSSSVTSYSDSADSPRVFTFMHKRSVGNKTYINGYLAAQNSDISNLTNITTLAIGKKYQGEIGEIIMFSKALDVKERQNVEQYIAKKWAIKISSTSESCTGGSVGDDSCIAGCSDTVLGVSYPILADNESSGSVSCDVTGYTGSLAYSCSSSLLAVTTPCDCDSGSGYVDSGGICVASCSVTEDGVSTTSVTEASGTLACDVDGYDGTVDYTCSPASPANIIGSCDLEPCTGGTITTVSGATIHKFTSSGTLNCVIGRSAKVLVVAGGGGGGYVQHGFTSGGGGAGGLIYQSSYSISSGDMLVTVGAGGNSGYSVSKGENSVFGSLTAIGGGYSGIYQTTASMAGGSGGGGVDTGSGTTGGSGTAGQGNKGGNSISYVCDSGAIRRSMGGGGGAGSAGQDGQDGVGGKGGDGLAYDITGTSTYYAGGGGGMTRHNSCSGASYQGGAGGLGGGGAASSAGSPNTGGGGGYNAVGGSGVVIISY
jgi:hypothetical protein